MSIVVDSTSGRVLLTGMPVRQWRSLCVSRRAPAAYPQRAHKKTPVETGVFYFLRARKAGRLLQEAD